MTLAYSLSDISVKYQHKEVLHIDDLHFEHGQSIAILGENGSGKSTLIHLLACTLTPSRGQITLFGETIHKRLSANQRRRIGLVDQHPYMLSGTVRDNIELALQLQSIPPHQHASLLEEALVMTNLTALADRQANKLSGGELKRAAIARAIVYQPDVLLLDEPFSHLDLRHIHLLEKFIEEYSAQADKTVIFSAHDRVQAMSLATTTLGIVKGIVSPYPLLNLFQGSLNGTLFETGDLQIKTNAQQTYADSLTVDPFAISVSRSALPEQAAQNQFSGKLVQISQEGSHNLLVIEASERFYVLIQSAALKTLSPVIGEALFLSFSSNATNVI